MAMTSPQPTATNPLKRKMGAPAYPSRRDTPQNASKNIEANNGCLTKNGRITHGNIQNVNTNDNGPTNDPAISGLDRIANNRRKSVPPAFAMGKGNQNEREMPPAYIMATSPVAIQGDYKRMKQLPLGLILMIVGFVSAYFSYI